MPTASGSLAFLGAARFQGYWDATKNSATGSGLPGQKLNGVVNGLFSTGSSSNAGGFANATGLTASIGDYWQVTGSGTHNVDGTTSWALNDWCVYSGSAGGTGNWSKLSFDDTIASIVLGDLSASSFHIGSAVNDKHVIFATGSVHSGSSNFTFDYTNNRVGIGTSSPAKVLHVNGASGEVELRIQSDDKFSSIVQKDNAELIIQNASAGDIMFYDDSAERMRIKDGGNVGIGSTSPEHRLSVTGTLGVSGDTTISGTLYANHLTASTISSSFYGDGTHLANVGVVSSIANGSNDRLVTFSSADALNGETNLTFSSANLLTVAGNITASTNVSASAFYGDGTNLTNVGVVSSIANGANDRLVTFSSADALSGEANLTFSSANLLTVAGNVTASSNISGSAFYGDIVTANIRSNTTDPISITSTNNDIILQSSDEVYILANSNIILDLDNDNDDTSSNFIIRNGTNTPIFIVAESTGLAYAAQLGVGTTGGEHTLSVTGTLGISGDTTISGSSYLKNIIVTPGASGGDGITVTHTDVDKHGIKVATTNATTGAPLFIDHNDSTTVASAQKASFVIDFDKTGIQAQSTTASYAAQDITMIDVANNHAGSTVHMTGSSIIVSSSYNGGLATTNTGLRVEARGADSNYDALFLGGNVGIGTATPASKLSILTDEPGNTVAHFFNDGDNINRYGISIQCGLDTSDGTSPTSNLWAALKDGNGTDKAYIAWVNGSSNAGFVAASDRRIKTDIAPTKVNALEVINNIPLSEFRMARKNESVGDLVKVGFIAQDCESAWPEMVTEWENEDYDHKVKAVSPATLIPVLVKAVQELSAEVQALKAK